MEVLSLIIGIAGLCAGCSALYLAISNGKKTVVETIKVEKVPCEHPFVFDKASDVYILEGDLEVTGSISSLSEAKISKLKKGGK